MITGAVVLVGKAFGEAAKKQKEFSDNVRNTAAVNAVRWPRRYSWLRL